MHVRDIAFAGGRGTNVILRDVCTKINDVHDLFLVTGQAIAPGDVVISPRVGVDYGKEWARLPLRFSVRGNLHVSKPNPEGSVAVAKAAAPPRKKPAKKAAAARASPTPEGTGEGATKAASTASSRASSKKRAPARTQPP